MKMKYFVVGCIAVGLLVAISGCIEEKPEEGGEVEAQMSFTEVRISDMPTEDFSHINITFSTVKLHKSGEENESGWTVINSDPKTFDLIYLHVNNLTEQLGIANVSIGDYDKLWIVVDNATGVLKSNNETVVFDVPSGTLKIQQLFKLLEGNNTITVDIDLDNSILVAGNVYKILPVVSKLQHHHEHKLQFSEEEVIVEENASRGKPIKVTVGEDITFNASETFDVEGENVTYYWDFDDGTNGSGAVVTHSYDEKGNYWVELTVTADGQVYTKYIHVTVKKGGQGNGGS